MSFSNKPITKSVENAEIQEVFETLLGRSCEHQSVQHFLSLGLPRSKLVDIVLDSDEYNRSDRLIALAASGGGDSTNDNIKKISAIRLALRRDTNNGIVRANFINLICDLLGPELAFLEYRALSTDFGASDHDGYAAIKFLEFGRGDFALQVAPNYFGENCWEILFNRNENLHESQVMIVFADGGYSLRFGTRFSMRQMLFHRLMPMLQYIKKVASDGIRSGRVVLTLDDAPEGSGPQLCFSGHDEALHFLIPDADFLRSQGYKDVQEAYSGKNAPWSEKDDTLFWRGSLSGVAGTIEDIVRLPRVRLSVMSAYFGLPHTDIRIVHGPLDQYAGVRDEINSLFNRLGILGNRVDISQNLRYRYLIDIDGNTNAWSGCFSKLMAGAAIIKVRSRYKQWYYDKMIDKKHVLYCDDIAELPSLFLKTRGDIGLGEALAEQSVSLANTITIQSEIDSFRVGCERFMNLSREFIL